MYTLYYMEGSCSLATLGILNEIGVNDVKVIDKAKAPSYEGINPVGAVPALDIGDSILCEGAAILVYLLDKHDNDLMPKEGSARQSAIENIMFANATMHPAYGRLFFLNQAVENEEIKQELLNKAADAITGLWAVVEQKLNGQDYLGGSTPSAADFLLSTYSRWGGMFPVNITIPEKAAKMVASILSRDSFIKALEAEKNL